MKNHKFHNTIVEIQVYNVLFWIPFFMKIEYHIYNHTYHLKHDTQFWSSDRYAFFFWPYNSSDFVLPIILPILGCFYENSTWKYELVKHYICLLYAMRMPLFVVKWNLNNNAILKAFSFGLIILYFWSAFLAWVINMPLQLVN